MKTFKMIRIYTTEAQDQKDAWTIFRAAESTGDLDQFFVTAIVKEEAPKTLLGQAKKQILG